MPADFSDTLLFGHDNTVGIVGLYPVSNNFSGNRKAQMQLILRNAETGDIQKKTTDFHPFFYLTNRHFLTGFKDKPVYISELSGRNPYRYVVAFDNLKTYNNALRHIQNLVQEEDGIPVYKINSPARQYLIQTGQTFFKGLTFGQVHRLQLDIETWSNPGQFPNARRPDDRIIIISMTDNKGWKCVLDERGKTEKELLELLVQTIQERNPDVIEGHNIFRFDLPYIMTRCRRHRVKFAIGRDGSEPRTWPASIRFAERSIDYPNVEIAGRHVIDTWFLAMGYDMIKRDLPGHGLKAVAKHFGFAPEGRTYIEGDKIAQTWDADPETVLAYALDDVIETERIAALLSGAAFYLSQIVPLPYQQVATSGSAVKIESLFVREYLRRRESLPKPGTGTQNAGGYTDIFITGVIGPIVYADVESLYPSIMLNFGIRPAGDRLNAFHDVLKRLTKLRFDTKNQMKTASSSTIKAELDARQNAFKILINSFYGLLGFSQALFNDYGEADRVTSTGRDILRQMMAEIRKRGGEVIEVDTDGVLFVPPADIKDETAERAFLENINLEMPAGIRIGFDGRFRKMLSYKKKNYALLSYDDIIKYKGSSLVSRAIEPFGRRFVRQVIKLLMQKDVAAIHALYLELRDKILNHKWHIDEFSRTESLKDSLDKYLQDVQTGKRSRTAAYELAISGNSAKKLDKGDRVSYYIAGDDVSYRAAKLVAQWDPKNPDENPVHYLKRLDEITRKFQVFFDPHHFRQVFSPEDLFGFDASKIDILVQKMPESTFSDSNEEI